MADGVQVVAPQGALEPVRVEQAPVLPPALDVAPPVDAVVAFAPPDEVARFSVDDVPSELEIQDAQRSCSAEHTAEMVESLKLHMDSSLKAFVDDKQRVWVPDLRWLRLRLCIVAHQASAGHRGVEVTKTWLCERFVWPEMLADIRAFVSTCIQCQLTRGGAIVPRPFRETIHASEPNEVLHMDFMYIAPAVTDTVGGKEYLLVLRDGFSKYTEMIPCVSPDALTVVAALESWFSHHGIVRSFVSDRGSHFMNSVVAELCARLEIKHHFVVAYAAHANGQIERVNREVKELLQQLCHERGLDTSSWVRLVPIVVSVLNNTPSQTLGGYAPITAFTGRPARSPLEGIFYNDINQLQVVSLSSSQVKERVEGLRESLDLVHAQIASKKPRAARTRPGEREVDFQQGDYVLYSKLGIAREKHVNKARTVWSGPARVLESDDEGTQRVFTIEDIGNDQVYTLHAQYLKRYHDASLVVTPQVRAWAARAGKGFRLGNIVGHEKRGSKWWFQVHWEGYTLEESTWEPLATLAVDVPVRLKGYVKLMKKVEDRVQVEKAIEEVRRKTAK
jgi:transposase InsO family protein